jgi:hypothetical protein
MHQEWRCPQCDRPLEVPDALLGQRVQCPACSTTFTAGAERAASGRALLPVNDRGPFSKSRRPLDKPSGVQTAGTLMLIGGILALVHGLLVWPSAGLLSGFVCCLWVPMVFSIVMGIMAIVKGAALMGPNAHLQSPSRAVAVMQIINIVNCDVVNLAMGIVNLNLLNDLQVRRYLRG